MHLLRFRVTKFRSVIDSGWIETDRVTALIGTNESGKTNLLIPLWKFNPANEGELDPVTDYPRAEYTDFKAIPEGEPKPTFIEAQFALDAREIAEIVRLTAASKEHIRVVQVSRDWDGKYTLSFPSLPETKTILRDELLTLVQSAHRFMTTATPSLANDLILRNTAEVELGKLQEAISTSPERLDIDTFSILKDSLKIEGEAPKKSVIRPRIEQLDEEMAKLYAELTKPHPEEIDGVWDYVSKCLPSFVYYSNYGNLDSEIYLPHVIANLRRKDLQLKEQAQARTLRVLFNFVGLQPQEILELGREVAKTPNQPTDEEVELTGERKKEREILLSSAGTKLTKSFREWWKQGEYIFRFQADGNHFRIWVSDDKRPEPVELEGRSTGLQWFLSFYLIFLVESEAAHSGAILLLDEPGLSLHPIAQEALSRFFDSLAVKNQLIYTTHSPFLIDSDHLERVKAVFVDSNGHSAVSRDLRASIKESLTSESIYPVHAALGLTVSKTLFLGCETVIVEGTADQILMSVIKTYMVRKGLSKPRAELLFVPAGGVSGITAVVSILTGKDEKLPFVIVDADKPGIDKCVNLRKIVYQTEQKRVTTTEEIIGVAGSEIEDLFPPKLFADVVGRFFRTIGYTEEEEFRDVLVPGPIVPQIEAFAKKHNIVLVKPGWKVEVAKLAKSRWTKMDDPFAGDKSYVDAWQKLLANFE